MAAAIRATSLGKRVVMIERRTIGGTCVNVGCVPSKALLAAADVRHAALAADRFPGLSAADVSVDMSALITGTDELVAGLRSEKYAGVADAYGWEIVNGEATFSGTPAEPRLCVTSETGMACIEAADYLVATGARPTAPAITGLDTVDYLTSTTAMELQQVPDSMIVIGGGFVAMEQAQLFARLGTRVTMLVRSRLARREEPEAGPVLAQVFADEGITVVEGLSIHAVSGGDAISVHTSRGIFAAAELLVATGRTPNTEALDLATIGVRTGDAGEVLVHGDLSTSNPRIHAAGDVVAHHQFVYVAAAHGAMVADNLFGEAHREVSYDALPRVTFTSPAIGSVGMTDEEATAAGIRCTCRVLPLTYVPRALVNRDTRGFIKIVANADTGRVLGITAVAKDAGELAAAGVHVVQRQMTVAEVAASWAPYLTMAEGIRIAAQSFTTDVSKMSCCA